MPAKILIIEDDVGVARLQQKRLERAGHSVETYPCPADAMRALEQGGVDLLILDYRLPDDRNGLEFYAELKQSGYDVPAILVTGFSNEALIISALRAGMRDFVSKSVEYLDYLPEAVAHVLHKSRMERQLAEVEARFGKIFHASPIPIIVSTLSEGRIVDINQACALLYGTSRAEACGKTTTEMGMVPQGFDREAFTARIRREKISERLEMSVVNLRGELLQVEVAVELIDLHGEECLLSMVSDVSERRRAEAALRESENRFQAFMNHSPAFAFLKDRESRYVFVNQSLQREFRKLGENWLGCTDDELFPPDVAAQCRELDRQVLEQNGPIESEETIPRDDEPDRTWLTLQFPVDDGQGNKLVGGLSLDITERKLAALQLELLQRAVNATSEAIVIADASEADLPIVFVNQAFEQITGYKPAETIGRNCRFLQGPDTDPLTADQLHEAVETGRSISVEILNYRRDGTPFWNLFSITPIRDAAQRITHFVGACRDITEHKLIAEQVRQSQKMEAIGRLAGGIAHDFNNILTIVLGNAELALEDTPKGDTRLDLLQEIVHAGQRAASLTSQLLAFSRRQVLEPKVVDLNVLVADTERLLRRLIGEDIFLSTMLAPHLRPVKVDPVQVEQILLNLTVNARDAMPEGGRLTIETQNVDLDPAHGLSGSEVRPGPYVMIAVTDTGHGMDEKTKSRIYEPFFTTKERGKGTGMGLPTVYGIVQQSGGYIWVDSEVDRGTTFKIYLPQHHDAMTQPVEKPMRRNNSSGVETLLLVEDEDLVRALARRMLESQGYHVLEARSGHEALEISQAYHGYIDLLITDVIMPGIGGRQLAQELAKLRPATRVLFISGYTDSTMIEQAEIDGNSAFLQKPFSHESLTNKVRQVLDDPQYVPFPRGGDANLKASAPGKSGGESSSPRR